MLKRVREFFSAIKHRRRTKGKFVDLLAVICFSIGGLLILRVPQFIPNDDLDSSFAYLLMAVSFFYFTWSYQLPTLKYFRLPELSLPSLTGLAVVVFYAYQGITQDRITTLPWWPTVTGIIYIFAIGAGEELLSRGFVLGVLKRHGNFFAVAISSILFGLMHINVYIGEWDGYQAYWHCVSAAGFGLTCAALMIATRSILSPIVMHALSDWGVAFRLPPPSDQTGYTGGFDPFLVTVEDTFWLISGDLFFTFILLGVLWSSRFLPQRRELRGKTLIK